MPATCPVMRLLTIGMMANVAPSAPCTKIDANTVMSTAITSQLTRRTSGRGS